MPIVRIDLPRGKPPEYRRGIGDVIDEALRATLNVPEADRFQIITEHAPDDLIFDPTYLGIARGPDALAIQVTLNAGRTVAMKKAFYRAVADGLYARLGVRREDVLINLIEVARENWSFGNGEAQYAS